VGGAAETWCQVGGSTLYELEVTSESGLKWKSGTRYISEKLLKTEERVRDGFGFISEQQRGYRVEKQ